MSYKRLITLFSFLLIFTLVLVACGGDEEETPEAAAPTEEAAAPTEEVMSFEGESVTIFTAAGEEQAAAFQAEFEGFTADTGI
ncbi:MAG: hypothetical protein ACK2T3_15455, partial [Candidatus Promineifilaceae bacterium]